MKISYHGAHSVEFCDHAKDSLKSILLAYLEHGYSSIAVTEHMPPPEDNLLYPEEVKQEHNAAYLQKRFQKYSSYIREELIADFATRMDILVGIETEWYSDNPGEHLGKILQEQKPEVIIASVHHCDNIPIDFNREYFNQALTQSGSLLDLQKDYFDNQLALFEFLRRSEQVESKQAQVIVGHMDLIRCFSPEQMLLPTVYKGIERNIECAINSGFIFELNLRAFTKGLHQPYPEDKILEMIATKGGRLTIGDDSHAAADVGKAWDRGIKVAGKYFKNLVSISKTVKDSLLIQEVPLEKYLEN